MQELFELPNELQDYLIALNIPILTVHLALTTCA